MSLWGLSKYYNFKLRNTSLGSDEVKLSICFLHCQPLEITYYHQCMDNLYVKYSKKLQLGNHFQLQVLIRLKLSLVLLMK